MASEEILLRSQVKVGKAEPRPELNYFLATASTPKAIEEYTKNGLNLFLATANTFPSFKDTVIKSDLKDLVALVEKDPTKLKYIKIVSGVEQIA
jgi:hypothetical protein